MNLKVRGWVALLVFSLLACDTVTTGINPRQEPTAIADPTVTPVVEPMVTPIPAAFYHATFDSLGSWGSGSDVDVEGNVEEGVFRLHVLAESGIFWSTAGENFGLGTYELDATQIAGTLDNGFGMMFRVDNDTDSFHLFEVSGDGWVWIGSCVDGCETDVTPLVEDGWFESDAVKQGLEQTNHLRVEANDGSLAFFVNDEQVGEARDNNFTGGDIGILVETLGDGGVTVHFDNFEFQPAPIP